MTNFTFSSLGKILPLGEDDQNLERYQKFNAVIREMDSELLSNGGLACLMNQMRIGLIEGVKLSPEQLHSLWLLGMILIVPTTHRWGELSNSNESVDDEPYSGKKINQLSKRFFDSTKLREAFEPLRNNPIWGQKFCRRIDRYAYLGSSLAQDFALIQKYDRLIRYPSLAISNVVRSFSGVPDIKNVLKAFVDDLNVHKTAFSKEERFNQAWVNFLKLKKNEDLSATPTEKKTTKEFQSKKKILKI